MGGGRASAGARKPPMAMQKTPEFLSHAAGANNGRMPLAGAPTPLTTGRACLSW
eukprot:CAMPEP_0176014998 /NCGR_PEP_ID=MMETSP0120_2-20121206/7111_1 /TAXON_ID=160619 /ORGANISM="Kryptoperidinium foliaceum, Strain CCMP 1326" /LENGTH=53 /DNA_ID=CAMNT_0017347955 /DNA_START=42 /DNA_END=203 /DNA_ORIENTATION=+